MKEFIAYREESKEEMKIENFIDESIWKKLTRIQSNIFIDRVVDTEEALIYFRRIIEEEERHSKKT